MTPAFSYDTVDYPAHVYPQLHPSRLAAIAQLHGIDAATPVACRLLEVGCGDGLQLLTLAMAYPESTFVGIDLSSTAIARGEALRQHLGLENLQLIAADLLQWQPDLPHFDYILAHGFYSWVPDVVRKRLWQLCQQHLTASGIACISYNALPGCHLRRMLWDALKFHSDGISDPATRIARARECLDLLILGMPSDNRYATVMAGEIEELKDRINPNVLFHDDLAELNQPFSFDEFIRAASAHGLAFVAEASYHEMSLRNAAEPARPLLEALAQDDIVTKEQYLDFFTGRRFRQTLLCRQEARPQARPNPAAVANLELVASLSPDTPEPDHEGKLRFSRPASGGVRTDNRVMQELLKLAGAHSPVATSVQVLLDAARSSAHSEHPRNHDMDIACNFLTRAFEVGVVELHCDAPRFITRLSEHPYASPLARRQVNTGAALVASLRPSMVSLDDEYSRQLLLALDGKHDRSALLAKLKPLLGQDTTTAHDVESELETTLQGLAAFGLLCEPDAA